MYPNFEILGSDDITDLVLSQLVDIPQRYRERVAEELRPVLARRDASLNKLIQTRLAVPTVAVARFRKEIECILFHPRSHWHDEPTPRTDKTEG